jgi:hypothetical protein
VLGVHGAVCKVLRIEERRRRCDCDAHPRRNPCNLLPVWRWRGGSDGSLGQRSRASPRLAKLQTTLLCICSGIVGLSWLHRVRRNRVRDISTPSAADQRSRMWPMGTSRRVASWRRQQQQQQQPQPSTDSCQNHTNSSSSRLHGSPTGALAGNLPHYISSDIIVSRRLALRSAKIYCIAVQLCIARQPSQPPRSLPRSM